MEPLRGGLGHWALRWHNVHCACTVHKFSCFVPPNQNEVHSGREHRPPSVHCRVCVSIFFSS